MYERSAIVLERYFNNVFGFNERTNLKINYKNYKEVVEEIQEYQAIVEEEERVISEFDKVANEIREIQKKEKILYKSNIKLEENRDQLFDNLEESPALLEKKLEKIDSTIDENNRVLIELRSKFINFLEEFNDKQKERNKCAKKRRIAEASHIQLIENVTEEIEKIDIEKVKELKEFLNSEENEEEKEISKIMINNGKDEKIKFNEEVVQKAVEVRSSIAKKEAECYIAAYEKLRRLLVEVNNDDIKIEKYKKILRDSNVKLEFLKAEKIYIIGFLDNERLTAINGVKMHKQMMSEACKNFELDIQQINNLYEIILKEISGKSTKKAYKELYNKEYLKNIEEKEKNFEQETNNIKISAGTIINQNYWRIEGIKNVYEVFQNEVNIEFEKDLSEFKLEEVENKEETIVDDVLGFNNFDDETKNEENKKGNDKLEKQYDEDEEEYENDEEYDEDEEDYENDEDEYDEDEEEYENDEDDEYDEDEEEYENDDDEYDEDEDEYENDDEEYDEDEDEYENDDEEYDEDEYDDIKENKSKNENKRGKNLFNKFFKDKKD